MPTSGTKFRAILPGEFQATVALAALREGNRKAAKEAMKEVEALTKDWKHKVKWREYTWENFGHFGASATTHDEIFNYWEEGTVAHFIHARAAQALRWLDRGKAVFAKWVWHPGTKGAHAVEKLREKWTRIYARQMQDACDIAARTAQKTSGEGRIRMR